MILADQERKSTAVARHSSRPSGTDYAIWLRSVLAGRGVRLYATLAGALVLLSLLLERFRNYVGLALLVPYLVLVVLAARWGGLPAAIFTSLAALPLVDYFLFEPVGRLEPGSRQNIQLLLVLLAGLLIGWLFDRLRVERLRAELAAAAERAALQERDALLSVIAHDLRSPLTAVKGRIQLAQLTLQREPLDPERVREMLSGAVPQVDRINRLLDDLLTTGNTNGTTLSVRPAELDLAPLLARVAQRWRSDARDHTIELHLIAPLPVIGDADRLEQVLDNLLANAAKYSPKGSTIRLVGDVVGDEVRLSVSDQGAGIPPDEQAQLFERFYRRPEHRTGRQPGLGLGLFITRELVSAQGGRIWVESVPGSGSTFVVSLPLRSSPATT
jgi:signal transduction histidine kinase